MYNLPKRIVLQLTYISGICQLAVNIDDEDPWDNTYWLPVHNNDIQPYQARPL